MATRAVLVDDHAMMREGLRLLLAQLPEIELVGEAASGEEAAALCEELRPDVVLMDVSLGVMDGCEATKRIQQLGHGVKVIGLSMYSDPPYVKAMRDAGARGYVLKRDAFDVLASVIRKVMNGETTFPE